MSHLRARLRREDGVAMVLVIVLAAFLTLTSITLIDIVRAESNRSAHSVWSEGSFQAAEAGIDDYVAKLVDNHVYYQQQVHAAESTRRPPAGADVSAGNAWSGEATWTYPNGKDAWKQLTNGYEYNLELVAPSVGSTTTRIVATGRKVGSTTDVRVIETLVRPSNLSDFYRFSDESVSIDAETFGKIYSNANVTHTNVAHADIFAEGSINGSPTMVDGAVAYPNGNFPTTKIKNHPIDFSKFLVSLVDIKRAAQSGGVYLYQGGITSWKLVFNADGTFSAAPCTGSNPQTTAPSCSAASTYAVPTNGAIFTDVTAIVEGSVNGRVTVGSGQDAVVSANLNPAVAGDDVIGLVAYNYLYVARYAPSQLTWTASVLVETETWRSADCSGYNGTGGHGFGSKMIFAGSSATKKGGCFTAYDDREYSYDPTLQYLPPPWFPAVDDTYTKTLFRELPGS